MRAFTAKGTLYIPTPVKVIKPQKKPIIIQECFCSEGHNLISSRFSFDGHKGILLKVRHGKNVGFVALSPICGQKNRIDSGIILLENDLVHMYCPQCLTRLPVYSQCECGANLVTFFLDRERSFSNCIGVCNRVGCKHAYTISQDELSFCSGLEQW